MARQTAPGDFFPQKLSLLTVHGYFVPLHIPHMVPIWDPDGGRTPESRQVSPTLPQRLVRVPSNVTLLLIFFDRSTNRKRFQGKGALRR